MGSNPGALCPALLKGHGTCSSSNEQLLCKAGRLVTLACPWGCQDRNGDVVSRQPIKEEDARMLESMCSPDKKAMWECVAGHWQATGAIL